MEKKTGSDWKNIRVRGVDYERILKRGLCGDTLADAVKRILDRLDELDKQEG